MYDYSGIIYKLLTRGLFFLLLSIVGILIDKQRAKRKGKEFKINNCKGSLIALVFSVALCLFYVSRIVFPDISSYTGVYQYEHKKPRGPLLTQEYVFWNGGGKNKSFYLDVNSKKKIFPEDFEEAEEYIIYYDELTKIIVGVERVE